MKPSHVSIGVAILAVSAFFFAGLPGISGDEGYAGLSPRFVPTLVAIGLAVCGALLTWQGVRGGFRNMPEEDAELPSAPHNFKGFLWVALGLVANMALIGTLGFVFSSTLMMVCVARGYGSRRIVRDALIGLLITVPMWALFEFLLGINLPLLPVAGFEPAPQREERNMDTLNQLMHGFAVAITPLNLMWALVGCFWAPRSACCRASARR
jgi:putative tricarboxylic transport membrane protein